MNLVLDECLPRQLRRLLSGHTVRTVQELGGAGLENGELLTHIASQCDVFITGDRNMPFWGNHPAGPF